MGLHHKSHSREELASSKNAVLAALDNLLEAKEHFTRAAEGAGLDIKYEASEHLHRGRERVEEFGIEAKRFVEDRPLASIGLLVVAGIFLSSLLSRK
jgi:ElaB/YqjD/DUF883 family membrane-anchored ribosome-binding protein